MLLKLKMVNGFAPTSSTRCTSHGKVCDVIINGESCENVVSKTMLKKLPLKVKEHPHPYKFSWLQKGNEVQVNKRCLVDFSIRKHYKDEVWCNVILMDACHLLLGYPWQYDRRVIHDSPSILFFCKNGTKIILALPNLSVYPNLLKGRGSTFFQNSNLTKNWKVLRTILYLFYWKRIKKFMTFLP